MPASTVGVLLALSGEDAEIVRCLNQPGSGMSVVRRCADLPELLSAGLAGLASIAVLDTGFEEIDRTVLERLEHAGLHGLLLVEASQEERWRSCGWRVERRDAEVGRIRTALQGIVRDSLQARSAAPGGAQDGSGAKGADPRGMSAEQQAAWLEEIWRISPDGGRPRPSAGAGAAAQDPSRGPGTAAGAPDPWALQEEPGGFRGAPGPGPGEAPHRRGPASGAQQGHLVVVWGTHGAPGRSTVAASLAHALGRTGGAILVDADVEAPCLVQLLGLPDDSSALAGAARLATHGRLDAETFSRFLTPVCQEVRLLGGLGRSGRWRELPPASMKEVWLQCRRAAAWTVVDVAGGSIDDGVDDFTLEPGRGAVAYDLVSRADVVVVVGAGDPVGVRRLLQLLADLDAEAPLAGRLQVVVNRVRASVAGPSPQQAVLEALGRFGGVSDAVLLPEDGATADRCLLQGRSIVDGAPTSPLGRALAGLAARIDPTAATAGARQGRRRWLAGRGPAGKGRGPADRSRRRARGERRRDGSRDRTAGRRSQSSTDQHGDRPSAGPSAGPSARPGDWQADWQGGPPDARAGSAAAGTVPARGQDPRVMGAVPSASRPQPAPPSEPPPAQSLPASLVPEAAPPPGSGRSAPPPEPEREGGAASAGGDAAAPGSQRRRPSPWLRPAFGSEPDRPDTPVDGGPGQ